MCGEVLHPRQNHTVITVLPLSRLPKLIQDRIPGLTVINCPIPGNHLVLTRMGEGFGEFMAEYVLGQIISREHYFSQMAKYQRQKTWSRSKFIQKRSLTTLTIGILGTGAIGIKNRAKISPNCSPDVTMSAVFYQAQWKPKGCYLEMF
uniref:D-isomer specific 2-hydroxyacid dehydrogenase NAD-binding domain-containing protein n=1 Tax=Magallana gigas TaxID=29159 RepID=A0A8W8LZV4_MAGGI